MAAVLVLAVVLVVSSVSGGNEKLCAAMGGSYTPGAYGAEQCPGGKYSNLLPRG